MRLWARKSRGVRAQGFSNDSAQPITSAHEAVERAANEVELKAFDSVSVAYDSQAEVWDVMFYLRGIVGGGVNVILGADGVTRLTVAGE